MAKDFTDVEHIWGVSSTPEETRIKTKFAKGTKARYIYKIPGNFMVRQETSDIHQDGWEKSTTAWDLQMPQSKQTPYKKEIDASKSCTIVKWKF